MTPDELLHHLKTVEFESCCVAATPRALRSLLRAASEVVDLGISYDSGCLSDEHLRQFVDELLQEGRPHDRCPFQTAFAAIASMLEGRFSAFAEEYLTGLAGIRSARFALSSGVAREAVRARSHSARNNVREFPPVGHVRFECILFAPTSNPNHPDRTPPVYKQFEAA